MVSRPTLFFTFSSILIVNILLFIDEGYYNFRWMLSFWNWIIGAIYGILLFGGQWLLYTILPIHQLTTIQAIIISLLGSTIGFLFTIFVVFTNW